MIEAQARKLFEKYNPASDVVRCPNGRARLRKPLDAYARAAVNLYGIIGRDEFVRMFNAQTGETVTEEEIYKILLPNVLKSGWYGFFKDYIVHYAVLNDFDWVDYLKNEQADKPRYIPPKEQFLQFELEDYEDNGHWQNVRKFMWDTFGYSKNTSTGFSEIKDYVSHSVGMKELSAIMERNNLIFSGEEQLRRFFDLINLAHNNTRRWENKGYTPNELSKLLTKEKPGELTIHQPKKVGPNQLCPCGSGKKYKRCCALIEESEAAQLTRSERGLFYETWYKLLSFVNQKLNVVDYKVKLKYPSYQDETLLFKIREKLWENPTLISEFIDSTDRLSAQENELLRSWEKHHIKGQFVLWRYEAAYAVFMRMDEGELNRLYAVKGMTTSIAEAMHRRLPIMLDTVLLPFGDKIIYDSFMASQSISFGDGIRDMFAEEYAKAYEQFGIMTSL